MVRRTRLSTLVTFAGLLLLLWFACLPLLPDLPPPPATSHVISSMVLTNSTTDPEGVNSSPKKTPKKTNLSNSLHTSSSNVTSNTKNESLTGLIGDLYKAGYEKNHSELCPSLGSDLQLIILITSAPSNLAPRSAIRMTWGRITNRTDISLAFVIGTPSDSFRPLIEEENILHGDIIVGRFVDSYTNLTLKSLSMLEWVNTYCPQVPRMLKTDDDMFINIHKLLEFVNSPARVNMTKTIWGKLLKNRFVIRSKKSKYYVSTKEFPGRFYPDFVTGPAYLMTTDVIKDFLAAAASEPYLHLEDVFITGILASKFDVKKVHVTEFYNKKITDPCKVKKGIAVHKVNYNEQFDMWRKLQDEKMKC